MAQNTGIQFALNIIFYINQSLNFGMYENYTAYVKNKDTCIIIHLIHLQFLCILNFCTLGGSSGLGHFQTILRPLIKRRPLYTDIEEKNMWNFSSLKNSLQLRISYLQNNILFILTKLAASLIKNFILQLNYKKFSRLYNIHTNYTSS